jgi:heme-degrading monooxygenase HmoA
MFAATPEPPYVAVIFTSVLAAVTDDAVDDYETTAARMVELARLQPGFLGIESARGAEGLGITVSYWADEGAARAWKRVAEHREAQQRGRDEWYAQWQTRVATVTRVEQSG